MSPPPPHARQAFIVDEAQEQPIPDSRTSFQNHRLRQTGAFPGEGKVASFLLFEWAVALGVLADSGVVSTGGEPSGDALAGISFKTEQEPFLDSFFTDTLIGGSSSGSADALLTPDIFTATSETAGGSGLAAGSLRTGGIPESEPGEIGSSLIGSGYSGGVSNETLNALLSSANATTDTIVGSDGGSFLGVPATGDGGTTDTASGTSDPVADSGGAAGDPGIIVDEGGTPLNTPPTDILVTGGAVAENAPVGTVVASVAAVDPDAGDTFTYALIDNAGGRFAIDPATGTITVADGTRLDFEAASTQGVTVVVTDSGGNTISKSFSIQLTDVNEAPASISISSATVSENAASGTVVGVIAPVDPDAGETFTFALTDNAGGRFAIDSATGIITVADGALLDFETATSHNVTVTVTDSAGHTIENGISIQVTDVYEGLASISISGSTIAENSTDGTVIGTVAAVNPGTTETFSYVLTDDAVGRFTIDPTTGVITVADGSLLDFEAASTHTVTVAATGSEGTSLSQAFSLSLSNVNEAPTSMTLSGGLVDENSVFAAVAGTVIAGDPDAGETFLYALSDDAGGRFAIDAATGQVTVADGALLDYEGAKSHGITVEVTDSGGHTLSQSFSIQVADVNEAPESLSLASRSVDENAATRTVVGTVTAFDPDAGDTFSFKLANDAGGRFTIDASTGVIRVADGTQLDYETAASHDVTVQVTDSGGNSLLRDFTINVNDLPESPPPATDPNAVLVSNAQELMAALNAATPGTVILLASGNYGDLNLYNMHFTDFVTLRSADGNGGAVFHSLSLSNTSYLRFDDITVERPLADGEPWWTKALMFQSSDHIELLNSDISSSTDGNFTNDGMGLFVRNSSNVVVDGNNFHDLVTGGLFASIDNLVVSGNTVTNMSLDAFEFCDISTGLIENNFATDFHPSEGAHSDFIQFWTTGTTGSDNVVIQGNVLIQSGDYPIQGIFINDEDGMTHYNFTIENNLIYNSSPHGISLYGAADSTISNNTVLAIPGSTTSASGIDVFVNKNGFTSNVTVSDNVTSSINGTAVITESGNVIVQWSDPLGQNYYADLFLDAFSGTQVSDFLPVPGSAIDISSALGAIARIMDFGIPPLYIASDIHDGTLQSLEPEFSAQQFATGSNWPFADGATLTYTWDFGDGTAATGQTVTHHFAMAGEHRVTLTVTDGTTSYSTDQTVTLKSPYLIDMNFEGSLENLADAGGTAVWTGSAGYVAGADGLAADFDGAGPNGYVTVSGVSSEISGMDELTIALDFKVDPTNQGGRLLTLHTGYSIFQSGSQITFQLYTDDGGTDPYLVLNDPSISDGQWHQLVATYDAASGTAALYLDGNMLVQQDGYTGHVNLVGNRDLTIGGWQWSDNLFDGQIDNVVLIQGVLTPSEIDMVETNHQII